MGSRHLVRVRKVALHFGHRSQLSRENIVFKPDSSVDRFNGTGTGAVTFKSKSILIFYAGHFSAFSSGPNQPRGW